MAIIHCPECNEKISSTVRQCVHCGVKIAVCPECEKIYTEHPNICTECGYVFSGNAKAEEEFRGTAPDVKRKWRTEKPFVYVIENVGFVCGILVYVWLFFATLRLVSWHANLADLENIAKSEEIYATIKTFIGLFAACWAIEKICDDICPTLNGALLGLWANIRKINLTEVIQTTFSADYREAVEKEKKSIFKDLKFIIYAAFLSNNYLEKNKRLVNHAVYIVFEIVACIFLGSFLVQNIELFMQAELLKSDILNNSGWSISLIESWWKPIAGIVLLVGAFFYRELVLSKLEKQRDAWIQKTMPEHYENYKKNALNVDY